MKHMEIEYKWQANTPRAFSRAKQVLAKLCGAVTEKKLHIQDTYLDDNLRRLSQKRIALRVRCTDGKWEATYKTRTQLKNGKAVRKEHTILLPHCTTSAQAISQLQRKKKWQGLDVSNVQPQFTITNLRTVFQFSFDGAELELALDNVRLHVCGRQVLFKEIELELKRASSKSLDRFARAFEQQTKLKRANFSKVKTAETLLQWWKK